MGKIIRAQRIGKGYKRKVPSHRYKKVKYPQIDDEMGKVIDIAHDPGHTAPLALVKFNNRKTWVLAQEGMYIGQKVNISKKAGIELGNILTIENIPEGLPVYNIEARPGDGGKFVRAAGNSAMVVSHGDKTTIQLPSGRFKSFDNKCRATIGVIAGSGRKDKPYAKAGKKSKAKKARGRQYPMVSGVAMNPVDHPHGGGGNQHVGKPMTVSKHSHPGRKVGHIAARRTGKR